MSRPIATFASPSLSTDQLFEVATVECWLTRPLEEEELRAAAAAVGRAGGGGSALDKAGTDRDLLEVAGVAANHSAGHRHAGPDE